MRMLWGLACKRQAAALGFLFVMVLAVAVGCAHAPRPGASESPSVAIDGQGVVRLNDSPVSANDLPNALRRARVPADRTLEIHFEDETGRRFIPELTAILRRAGYRKVLFAGERRATATVGESH